MKIFLVCTAFFGMFPIAAQAQGLPEDVFDDGFEDALTCSNEVTTEYTTGTGFDGAMFDITIQSGQTYGFGVNFSGGTSVGQVFASNANIQVKEGVGNQYPFIVLASGAPRVWNGTVHYCP